MNINEIVKVETLPKIVQQLNVLSVEIDNVVNDALALECNEESKQEVKKARANLNKIKTELEDRRKYIKEQILEPYNNFEKIYNELIKDKLTYGEQTLKSRVDEIESIQKQEKENNIIEYFNEYAESLHLTNIIKWDQLNIKIGLSDTEKKLREQVKSKLDSISNDVNLILLEEYHGDIMVEYLANGFDFSKAKLTVLNRNAEKRKVEEEKLKMQQQEQLDKKLEQAVEKIVIPTDEVQLEEENKNLITRFEVEGTREQLINLKNFMVENNYKFRSL